MTTLLERAIEEAAKLPEPEQDALGSFLLAEIQSEREWITRFQAKADALSSKAGTALDRFKNGQTEEFDPTRL